MDPLRELLLTWRAELDAELMQAEAELVELLLESTAVAAKAAPELDRHAALKKAMQKLASVGIAVPLTLRMEELTAQARQTRRDVSAASNAVALHDLQIRNAREAVAQIDVLLAREPDEAPAPSAAAKTLQFHAGLDG